MRRDYQAPVVTDYGTVSRLTQGMGGSGVDSLGPGCSGGQHVDADAHGWFADSPGDVSLGLVLTVSITVSFLQEGRRRRRPSAFRSPAGCRAVWRHKLVVCRTTS